MADTPITQPVERIYEDDALIVEIHHEGLEPSKSITAASNPKKVNKLEYIEATGKMKIYTNKELPNLMEITESENP